MGLKPAHTTAIASLASVMEHDNVPRRSIDDVPFKNDAPYSNGASLLPEASPRVFEDSAKLLASADPFDDDAEAEIEAAAAMSETPIPIIVSQPAPRFADVNKPLHVQVNGFSGSSEPSTITGRTSSRDSPFSSFSPAVNISRPGMLAGSPSIRRPPFDYAKPSPIAGPSNSGGIGTLMGPPSTSTSVRSMLSPAAALGGVNNGFSAKSNEPSPASPSNYRRFVSQQPQQQRRLEHRPSTSSMAPTPVPRPTPQPPHRVLAASQPNAVATAAQQRKEADMAKRKMFIERIHNSRETKELVNFIPQMDTQSDNQIAMLLRRYQKTNYGKEIPGSLRHEVFEEEVRDHSDYLRRVLRENTALRVRGVPTEDVTDESDTEPIDTVPVVASTSVAARKIDMNRHRWMEAKVRFGYQDARCTYFLEDRTKEMRLLENELNYMNQTLGTKFQGDPDFVPRKRRRRNRRVEFDYSGQQRDFARQTQEERDHLGCARARPLISYTKRHLVNDLYKKNDTAAEFKPYVPITPVPSTSFQMTVTTVDVENDRVQRDTEEIVEDDWDATKPYVYINAESDGDFLKLIPTPECRPFEARMLSYFHHLSTVPAMTLRRTTDQSIFLSTGDDEKTRNGISRVHHNKEKKTAREEYVRRRLREHLELSSDDGEEDNTEDADYYPDRLTYSRRTSSRDSEMLQKRRGRPSKRGGTRNNNNNNHNTSFRSREWTVDDFYLEDPSSLPLPPKLTYARIHLPKWEDVPDFELESAPDSPSTSANDDLLATVARSHHALTYLEREKVKREMEKKHRAGQPSAQVGKMAPLSNQPGSNGHHQPHHADSPDVQLNDEELLQELPPFDLQSFTAPKIVQRIHGSTEKPFTTREFQLVSKI